MHVWDVKWIFMRSMFIVVVRNASLKPLIIWHRFFLQAVFLRQFVATGIFSVSVCGQWLHQFEANFILLALQKHRFLFHEFFTVPINRGWGSTFGTTECRTADISEFWNFEYKNNESRIIRFCYFWIDFLFIRFFSILRTLKIHIWYII